MICAELELISAEPTLSAMTDAADSIELPDGDGAGDVTSGRTDDVEPTVFSVADITDSVAVDSIVPASSEVAEAAGGSLATVSVLVSSLVTGAAALGAGGSFFVPLPFGFPLLSSIIFSHILATCGSTNNRLCSLANIRNCFNAALI